ncbi:MAG: response regulator transcription factor [Lachnospiraceae bacterium]|nr:response regulator transcription factor [Lachnospiraceae bacterium]
MYRILLCEDSEQDRIWIKGQLDAIFDEMGQAYQLSEFMAGEQVLFHMEQGLYDIAIFDVELGRTDGIEIAKRLRQIDRNVVILFISVHSKNVFSCFTAEPLIFLSKPLKKADFASYIQKAVQKADEILKDRYTVSMNSSVFAVSVRDILYFESTGRTVRLRADRTEFVFYGKLSTLEEDLRLRTFFRCHQSYLVNMDHCFEITGRDVRLSNGERIPVSRSKNKEFKEAFMRYLGRYGKGLESDR